MDYVVIGDTAYDVIVKSVSEKFDILHSDNAGRTSGIGSKMTLDPLGAFIGHKVTFYRKDGQEALYDRLFNDLLTPRYNGLHITVPHDQGVISYDAYVSTGERAVQSIDKKTGKTYWGEFSVQFTPMEAQVTV